MPQELRPDVILAYKKYEWLWALFSRIVLTLSPSSKLGRNKQVRSWARKAVEGTWVIVIHPNIGPGVGNKSTLDSGPCMPKTKHRATACSMCGSGKCASSGC